MKKFLGRKTELKQLKKWILKESCRVVSIFGMGGIGKTTLVRQLIKDEEIDTEFGGRVFGRSLQDALPLNELIQEILLSLSDGEEIDLPEGIENKIRRLGVRLRERRCLVIIDNVEGILVEGKAGNFLTGYEDYRNVLELFAQQDHRSCLLLTSREKPQGIAKLELSPANTDDSIKSLNLKGLNIKDGKKLFNQLGKFADLDKKGESLITDYAGNPLALNLVSRYIKDYYSYNISEFLSSEERRILGESDTSSIRQLLDWYFGRLTKDEKEIMYWLSIEREAITMSELKNNINIETDIPSLPTNIGDNLQSLDKKYIIEKKEQREHNSNNNVTKWTLHPYIMEYFTEKFIEQICASIKDYDKVNAENYEDSILNSHVFIKATAKAYIRESQISLILIPATEKLTTPQFLGNKKNLEEHLKKLILDRQNRFPLYKGYTGGNIINLLVTGLKADLRGYNFSNLKIYQAYLAEANLPQVDFTNSIINNCVFADTLDCVFSVAFSNDGKHLAAGDSHGHFHVWNFPQCYKIAPNEDVGNIGLVWSIVFHPTQKSVLATGSDQNVKIWNIENEATCTQVLGENDNSHHTKPVRSVSFSPSGEIIATGGTDKIIIIWRLNIQSNKYEYRQTLREHSDAVWSVTFSFDGKLLASASDDNTVKLWRENSDTQEWECCYTLEGHRDSVRSVAFSHDGELLASGSQDNTVKVWNLKTRTCQNTLETHSDWVWSVVFSPVNKEILASCSEDQTIRIWDLETGHSFPLLGHDHAVRSISFNHNGKLLLSGSYDQSVKLWEWDDESKRGQCIKTWLGLSSPVRSISFHPNNAILASGGGDRTVRLWHFNNEPPEQEQKLGGKHHTWIWSVAFSSDGHILATCSDDKTIRLWNIEDGTYEELTKLSGRTRTLAFSPNGKMLAIGCNDHKITLWRRYSLEEDWILDQTLELNGNWIWSVTFSFDSKLLASGSEDKTINIWDVASDRARLIHTIECESMVYSVAFSPNQARRILAGSITDSHNIDLWDVEREEVIHTLKGHKNWVWSVVFSPDGKIVASGSSDHTIKLWDVQTGECLNTLPEEHKQWVRTIAISSDGKLLASAGDDEYINLWNIDDISNVQLRRSLTPERPYEGMIIKNVTLTSGTMKALKMLGAKQ